MLIKNINYLTWLEESEKLRLEQSALAHQRFSNITFKIIAVNENDVTIAIFQGKSFQENHFDIKRLVEIAKENFTPFIVNKKILVQPSPYKPSPVEVVNSEWITAQMSRYHIALKQLAIDTGINKSSLSSVITGQKPLSDPMRAMFYYFFKGLEKH